jgi:hypothetical protein
MLSIICYDGLLEKERIDEVVNICIYSWKLPDILLRVTDYSN